MTYKLLNLVRRRTRYIQVVLLLRSGFCSVLQKVAILDSCVRGLDSQARQCQRAGQEGDFAKIRSCLKIQMKRRVKDGILIR